MGGTVGDYAGWAFGGEFEAFDGFGKQGSALAHEVLGQDLGEAERIHGHRHVGQENGADDTGTERRLHLARLVAAHLLDPNAAPPAQVDDVFRFGQVFGVLEDLQKPVAPDQRLGAGFREQWVIGFEQFAQKAIAGVGNVLDALAPSGQRKAQEPRCHAEKLRPRHRQRFFGVEQQPRYAGQHAGQRGRYA